jgi:hypothetical protein
LLQEGENDVTIGAGIIAGDDLCKDFKIAASNSKVPIKAEESIMMINYLGKASDNDCKELKIVDTVVSKSHMQFGSLSNFVQHKDNKKDENLTVTKIKKPVEIMPKPRTALFQGGENDEPMAPQVNLSASIDLLGNNMKEFSFIKFGSFSFEEWQSYLKRILSGTSTVATKTLFTGANLMKKTEKNKQRKYIQIGAVQVDVDDELPI